MSEERAPYFAGLNWRLQAEPDPPEGDGCLWIHGKDGETEWSRNLGPKDAAFEEMVRAMEADDFGERTPSSA
jgi:hypothetical protein